VSSPGGVTDEVSPDVPVEVSRDVTGELAAFAAELRLEDLPVPVREQVVTIVVDAVASALAGYDAEEVASVESFARGLGASSESTVIGGGRMSTAGAIVMNGYLITAITICDMHRPTTCHVSPEVVAPALVEGEARHASGRDALTAIAAGLEVTTRVGLGLNPAAFRAREWHAPGVIGPFGGAAAVGRLLGLRPKAMACAFGLAASQAAGTYAHLGTPTMKFQQARAALSGSMAAQLAGGGFTASEEILTQRNGGLFSAYSDGGDPGAVVRGLGDDWELARISLRPWPVAMHLQPVVTAVMELIEQGPVALADIATIRTELSPTAYRMHADVPWSERFRARLSAPYVTAVALVDGRCGLDQFSAARINDPILASLIHEQVTIVAAPERQNGTARLSVETVDGTIRSVEVAAARGEPSNPMTRQEVVEKFRMAAASRLSATNSEAALEMLLGLEDLADVAALLPRLGQSR
jgi:2-methylcitrate dehydratase PrpD